jgi:hypothetical protein
VEHSDLGLARVGLLVFGFWFLVFGFWLGVFSPSHFLFREFTTEWHAQKSTQRKRRDPKLGAEGIAPYEVSFEHYALICRNDTHQPGRENVR